MSVPEALEADVFPAAGNDGKLRATVSKDGKI